MIEYLRAIFKASDEQESKSIVMLSAAKHLAADGERPFAALRACPQRSECGDTEGKHSRHARARQHGQVLLNHALSKQMIPGKTLSGAIQYDRFAPLYYDRTERFVTRHLLKTGHKAH
jgi:hypothetical protein